MKKYLLSLILMFVSLTSAAQAQTCIQPAANMVSWWRAEGTAQDARGLHNGTLQNGASFAAGRVGQAFSLDGANDAILLGNLAGLQPASLTLEAWINVDSIPDGEVRNVFAKWGFDATVDSYLFGVINNGGQLQAFGAIGDGSTGDPGLQGGTFSTGAWNHLAMTYNAADGAHKLYLNGAEVAARTRPNGIFPTASLAYIGRQDSPLERLFDGLIDEPALYSRALSAAEIQAIFNAGSAGKCASSNSLSGSFSQKQKITPNPLVGSTGFGNSVAIDGETMVVGASGYDTTPSTGINIGTAYVFVRSNGAWTQQARLSAADGAAGDEFGYSVAISGDTIVVGAHRSDASAVNSGAAYVFVRSGSTWTQQQKLTAADGAGSDEFGTSVAIGGETVVIGAHRADQPSGGGDAGAVYVFNRSGSVWSQSQKLIPTGSVLFGDFLGASVAMSGDTLASGAPGDQEPSRTNRGTVYVYTRGAGGTWTQEQKLVVPDSQPSTQLGSSVAIDGETLISGALGDTPTTAQPNHGAAYIFARNLGTWSLQQRLTASDGAMSDFFGWSVAVKGDTAIVGARFDDTSAGADAGSAYVFTRSGANWTERQKLAAGDAAQNDRFGIAASLNADGTLVIGASEKNLPNGQGNTAGAAYVFNINKYKVFDFDGDGKTDIGIFRPSDGSWWYSRSSDGEFRVFPFGAGSDVITPGDFTGDGKADIAVFRPSTGFWFIQRSEDNSFFSFPFGSNGDIPTPSDFDGDGKTDAAVFRPSTGTWFILNSSGAGTSIVSFGASEDKPVAADYDGDGKADIAIFRPSDGSWWYLRSSDAQFRVFRFGIGTDKPVPGDYTGDGRADIAIFRPSSGVWFFLRSEDNTFFSVPFGAGGDMPAPGDYDGDGRFDTAVFRPATANWFVQRSSAGILIASFGAAGDRPIPNSFVP